MSDVQKAVPHAPVAPPAKLPVAVAAGNTWQVFRQRPWTFALLGLLPVVATFVAALVPAFVRSRAGAGIEVGDQVLVTIVQYGVQFICQNATIYGAWRLAEGQTFRIGEAIGVGTRRLLPYAGIAIMTLIVVVIGFILLVIPGLIVIIYLSLAAPACVIERRGPIASLDRSVRLVSGNWWRIVGVGMLAGFLPFLGACAGIGLLAAALAPLHAAYWALVLFAPAYLVFIAVGAIMLAVIFLELRAAKEGRAPDAVVGVFD